ncbi:unnamed protein product, partial [Aureobasidium uvarum]
NSPPQSRIKSCDTANKPDAFPPTLSQLARPHNPITPLGPMTLILSVAFSSIPSSACAVNPDEPAKSANTTDPVDPVNTVSTANAADSAQLYHNIKLNITVNMSRNLVTLVVAFTAGAIAVENGLARTPQMGWV